MNIAYVYAGRWPSVSPGVTFASYTAAGIAERGHTCHFYVRKNKDISADQVFRDVFNRNKPENLIVHQVPDPCARIRTSFFFYLRTARELKKLARAGALDAVITRSCSFIPYLVRLRKTCGVQVWFESHDFYADLSVRDDLPARRWRRESRIERTYLPKMTGLFCLQESQASQYRRLFPDLRIVVARTGCGPIVAAGVESRSSLVYIGSLDAHKGVEGLIESVSQSRSRPQLVIIGGKTESEKQRVMSVAETFGYASRTKITGWIDKGSMDEYLRNARAGAVPLVDTFFNRYLTSPLKIFDFYRYGIPVIASDLPTVRELVSPGETGVLCTPGSVRSLSDAIDTLFALPDSEYRAMIDKVYKRAESLQWTQRAERITEAFVDTRNTVHAAAQGDAT